MAAIVQQVVGGTTSAVGGVLKEVGAAINPGMVPMQQSMDMNVERLGVTVEQTIHLKAPDGSNEVFLMDELAMEKLVQNVCCPVCCTYIPFTSDKRKMEYKKLCGCCSCRWAVSIDDVPAGQMADVGCCDNGCLFCMCPCLTCDGYVKLMGLENANKEEKFVFLSKLMPCWPLAMGLGALVGGITLPCLLMQGCYQYVNGQSIKTISMPVYQGPWSRGKSSGQPPLELGKFYIAQRFIPIGICCAAPIPMRVHYKATNTEGYDLGGDSPLMGMVLSLIRGMPTPCKCCSPAGFRVATGWPCFDIGLETETTWSSTKEAMNTTKWLGA
jgi:hypothetical protein